MSQKLDRRTVLHGIGTAVALPYLEAMLPLSAMKPSAPARPVRMAFCFVPNGIDMKNWTPATEGTDYAMTKLLEPLSAHRKEMLVLTGLTQANAEAKGDGPGDHARSTAAWLTGVHPRKTAGSDIRAGISADQVAAMYLGTKTRFPSLEIGCERGAVAGDCDSGYSCAYSSNISWRSESTPNPKEVNPRLVFERLFGKANEDPKAVARRNFYRQSILDLVMEDASRLKGQLGGNDAKKLDEYMTSVREIEKRIQGYEAENAKALLRGVQRPTGIPPEFIEHLKLMADMLVLAFQTDQTRIATFMFANEGSNRSYPLVGVSEGHHDMSHHGHDPNKLERKYRIDRFHTEQFAYLCDRMASVKELDGSLLDNSMLIYGGGISDGDRHNHDDLPIVVVGKGGGGFKTGAHVRYPNRTPLNNLYLSMLDRMGVAVEKLGDSTGKLQGLW